VEESCTIEIYNMAGMRAFKDQLIGGSQYQISLPRLQGAFIAVLTSNHGRKTEKVVF
jgi:hypothetical protein